MFFIQRLQTFLFIFVTFLKFFNVFIFFLERFFTSMTSPASPAGLTPMVGLIGKTVGMRRLIWRFLSQAAAVVVARRSLDSVGEYRRVAQSSALRPSGTLR